MIYDFNNIAYKTVHTKFVLCFSISEQRLFYDSKNEILEIPFACNENSIGLVYIYYIYIILTIDLQLTSRLCVCWEMCVLGTGKMCLMICGFSCLSIVQWVSEKVVTKFGYPGIECVADRHVCGGKSSF